MSDVVLGKDVLVYVVTEEGDLAITCWANAAFNFTNELILKTDVNAGLFRKRRVRISDCGATVSGLFTLENEPGFVSGMWFLQESIRRTELELKFVYTDEGGIIKQLVGNFVIESISIPTDISNFTEANISFQGTGGIEMSTVDPISGVTPPTCDEAYALYMTLAEGDVTVSNILLAANTVLEVAREGIQYDVILSGTPTATQVLFSVTDLTFLYPANPGGERIYVLYKVATP